jgi:AIPR protein
MNQETCFGRILKLLANLVPHMAVVGMPASVGTCLTIKISSSSLVALDSLASDKTSAGFMVIQKTKETKMSTKNASSPAYAGNWFKLNYQTLKSVSSTEDQEAKRKRYCGVIRSDQLAGLNCSENVREYLGLDEDGNKRKSTAVNLAIKETLENKRDLFQMLNAGVVIVARAATINDDSKKEANLLNPSIINGAQTKGVIEEFFKDNPDDKDYPSVNFELIVVNDDDETNLVGEISVARNFQNKVSPLSIYGTQGHFDKLEEAMRRFDSTIKLRRRETDFSDEFIDTEKLIQVVTAFIPKEIPVPSADPNKKSATTIYRVYAYSQRSRCLKDFAEMMEDPRRWKDAKDLFLDIALDAWQLYLRLKKEQSFSRLECVKGTNDGGKKIVAADGVPDGIVFPMLSALSRFVRETSKGWKLDIPKNFPWKALFDQAYIQETTTAGFNPQTMGKSADCYVALHGSIDMFFAVMDLK